MHTYSLLSFLCDGGDFYSKSQQIHGWNPPAVLWVVPCTTPHKIKSYKSCDLITNLINLSGVWREWSSKEMLVPKQLCFVAHIKRAFLSFLVPRHRFITSIICARGMPTLPTPRIPGGLFVEFVPIYMRVRISDRPNYGRPPPCSAGGRQFIGEPQLARVYLKLPERTLWGSPMICMHEL